MNGAMLGSERLLLTPLSIDALISITDNSADLPGILIEPAALSDTVKSAIQKKIAKMRSVDAAMHDWYTYWLIVSRESGQGIGFVGFKGIDENGYAEIGYSISPAYRRQGLMMEAVQALIDWARQYPNVKGVIATRVLKTNTGSNKVLQHCGFELTGSCDTENAYCYKFRE